MSKTIAVDFDGTIAKTRYPYIEHIYPEASLYLRKWKRKGHKIILWTCREGQPLVDAIAACLAEGIQFDAVNDNLDPAHTSRKITADYYIDDKNPSIDVLDQFWHVNDKLK